MSSYWRGLMNWPLNPDWKCETCEQQAGLTWGLVHGECRCDQCHTQYTMRAASGEHRLTVPLSLLREEYKAAAHFLWKQYRLPVDEASDEQWDTAIGAAAEIARHLTTSLLRL